VERQSPGDRLDPGAAVSGPDAAAAADASTVTESSSGFTVRLANFTGPFDLLLQLIGKHKLDVTEVALHRVTDDFIAYIRAMGAEWDLDEVSEFLVVAATLLDLKAARLLPSASVENEEDLALLEARDLLFARLLQYQAFKQAAAHISGLESVGSKRYPRAVSLEDRFAQALPELVLGIGAQRLADIALRAFTPRPVPQVAVDHVHEIRISVREHAEALRELLISARVATFRELCAGCGSTLEVIARFLALLEMYREGVVAFDQVLALGELTVTWTGPDDSAAVTITVDEYAGAPVVSGDGSSAVAGPVPPDAAVGQPDTAVDPPDGGVGQPDISGMSGTEGELDASMG